MATLRIKFLATSVKMQMHLQVFLPDSFVLAPPAIQERGLKALWLLHGEGGDCSDWSRLTNVERWADEANLALIMPNMDNSMYMDMAHGRYPYFTYLTEELPAYVRNLVRLISGRKEDNFVAGFGVGGYGAVKWLLNFPDMFSAAACLCGDVDMVSALERMEGAGGLADDWAAAFGCSTDLAGSRSDNLHMLRRRVEATLPPLPIYLASTMQDGNAGAGRKAVDALREAGADPVLYEGAGRDNATIIDDAIADFILRIVASRDGAS
jgi:S-formylglutathione hydrolase FrmB